MIQNNQRVLTGMRTTGALHLGHYVGALKNFVDIQNKGEHECFFLLADYQALTTHAKNPQMLQVAVRQCVLDWMSAGLDPLRGNVNFVLQSQVKPRYELSMLLAQVTSYNRLMQNPTLKAELEREKSASVAFMMYPLDQVGDIQMIDPMVVGGSILVPVGKDQAPHLEFARDVVRIMNREYLTGELQLTECEALIGDIGRLVGTDGSAKMSKSLGNTINLTDSADEVASIIKKMKSGVNDDSRFDYDDDTGEKTLYGHPTFISISESFMSRSQFESFRYLVTNPVIEYVLAFLPPAEAVDVIGRYHDGTIRYSEVKARLTVAINDLLDPIRARRAEIEDLDIRDILQSGTNKASLECQRVVDAINDVMYFNYPE